MSTSFWFYLYAACLLGLTYIKHGEPDISTMITTGAMLVIGWFVIWNANT